MTKEKIIIVKYGGSAMINDELKMQVIADVIRLRQDGFRPIIVHGGGKEISRQVALSGMIPEFVNGLRKTDAQTLQVVEKVLCEINKSLVDLASAFGISAAGVNGMDRSLLRAKKKYADGQDIGFVGEVTEVDTALLYEMLVADQLPIICPIAADEQAQHYNINADDAACAIAKAVGAESLVFLTDTEGVYTNPSDADTLASSLSVSQAEKLLASGYIGGGMLPKLQSCTDALVGGVSRVHILDGRVAHCLLLAFINKKRIGTVILQNEE